MWGIHLGSLARRSAAVLVLAALAGGSCVRNPPPVEPEPTRRLRVRAAARARPDTPAPRPSPRPTAPQPPPPVLPEEDEFTARSLEEINQ